MIPIKTFVIAFHYSSLFHEAQAFRFVNVASSSLLKKAEGESINPKRTENFNLTVAFFHEAQAFRFVNVASSRLLKKAEGESINPKRTENFNLIIGSINLRTPIQWIILVSKSTQVKPIPIEAIQSINKIN